MVKCTECGRHIRKRQASTETYHNMLWNKDVSRNIGSDYMKKAKITRRCPFCDKR